MTRWKEILLILLLLSLMGCLPLRVSVRNDGVMAFVGKWGEVAYAYNPHTEKLSRIKLAGNLAGQDLFRVDWSPDGKQLLVVGESKVEGEEFELQVGAADGRNFKRLAATKNQHYICSAQWRPDGKAVTFVVALGEDKTELRQVDLETGQVKVLAKNVMVFHKWHPDGGVLLAARYLGKGDGPVVGELVGVDPDGDIDSGVALLIVNHPWLDFSPDGTKLLFCAPKAEMPFGLFDEETVKKKLSLTKLYVVDEDQKEVTLVTHRDIGYAEFSPDGKHILFVELRPGKRSVVGVMKPDGTEVIELDRGRMTPEEPGRNGKDIWGVATFQPVWLSNSRVLYYKDKREGFDDIEEMWAIDINGRNKEDLGAKLKKLIEALPPEKK